MPQADSAHTTTLSRRRFLASATAVAAGAGAALSTGVAAAEPHADAELIELGRQLAEISRLELAAIERGTDWATTAAAQSVIIREGRVVHAQILAVQPVTLEGLAVKARALLWETGESEADLDQVAAHCEFGHGVLAMLTLALNTVAVGDAARKAVQS